MSSSSIPQPVPDHVVLVGGGHWLDAATESFAMLVRLGGLTKRSSILDVGCGFGRHAILLAYYLGREGSYDGFDANPDMIAWARNNITPVNDSFRFTHADVSNSFYAPSGSKQPDQYVFPYDDDSFDLVFAYSVFTHLDPLAARNYLRECRRVLKPDGRLLTTWFLLDTRTMDLIDKGRSDQNFVVPLLSDKSCMVRPSQTPEHAAAYQSGTVLGWAQQIGLDLWSMKPGIWRDMKDKQLNRQSDGFYQDVLIFTESEGS